MSAPVVIIGTGLAGYNLAREFRKLDTQTPLLLITADDGRSYSKPLLSTGFAANKNAESLGMATAGAMAEQLNAEIRIHTRVTRLDPANRRVWIGNEPVSYRDLVLAWGAQTIQVPVAGDAADAVFPINDLHDYGRFRAAVAGKRRVLILGAGVAGLQAIATAKRLGAVVEASDVRPAVKEQIESLGAKFVDVPLETDEERECAEGVGGYARPMPASWMARQAQAVHERALQSDIVITTALIPGRKAPTLLQEATVEQMKPGSVIVDLAAGHGGNCPLTEIDQVVVRHGVTIVGHANLATLVAADASALYARNLLDFLKLVIDKDGQFQLNLEDDIVAACLMCRDGQVVRTNG